MFFEKRLRHAPAKIADRLGVACRGDPNVLFRVSQRKLQRRRGVGKNGDISAYIGGGADVRAANDVAINALAVKDIESIAVSASAGLVGVAGSVSVWTIGTTADGNYSVDDETEDSLDTDGEFKETTTFVDSRTDEFNSLLGGYAEAEPSDSDLPDNAELIKTGTGSVDTSIDESDEQTRGQAFAAVTDQDPDVTGTVAYVGENAVVSAGVGLSNYD